MAGTGDRTGRRSRAKTATSGAPPVLRVSPAIPQKEEDIQVLTKYLDLMGCKGLLEVPWGFKEEQLAVELIGSPDNRYDGSIRAHPYLWTTDHWRQTYNFRKGAVRTLERNDELLVGEFSRSADPKDGFNTSALTDPHARLVIDFLNPIFHPEKPKRVVAKWACTFLGAMRGKIRVDWGTLMWDLADRLVKNLRKAKKSGTPLPAYLAHLYYKYEVLSGGEQDEYEELLNIQKYGGPETDSGSDSDGAESPPEIEVRTRKRSRSVQREPEQRSAEPHPTIPEETLPESSGRPPMPDRIAQLEDPHFSGVPAEDIMEMLKQIATRTQFLHQGISDRGQVILGVVQRLGVPALDDIIPRIQDLQRKEVQLTVLEDQQKVMTQAMTQLREQVRNTEGALLEARRQKEEAEERANASAKALGEVRNALEFPADTVNRSLLYTEELEKGERLNRGQIIRFLLDHGRKMEGTWEKMQQLVRNMSVAFPTSQGTQTPAAPTVTPVRAEPSGTSPGGAEAASDLFGTPDFASPMNWTNLPTLDSETLKNWKGISPEVNQLTPLPFRIPDSTPRPRRRATMSPPRMGVHSPTGSFRDLLETISQLRKEVPDEELTILSGSQDTAPEAGPEVVTPAPAPPPSPTPTPTPAPATTPATTPAPAPAEGILPRRSPRSRSPMSRTRRQ